MHATLIERKFDKASAEMLEEPTIRVSLGAHFWSGFHCLILCSIDGSDCRYRMSS